MAIRNILLVDDEELLLNNLKFLLESETDEVFIAKNGLEALNIIQNHPITCVISDITMPVMSGMDLLKEIRERKISTSFVFYSAYINEELLNDVKDLGVTAFIKKPEITELETFVQQKL